MDLAASLPLMDLVHHRDASLARRVLDLERERSARRVRREVRERVATGLDREAQRAVFIDGGLGRAQIHRLDPGLRRCAGHALGQEVIGWVGHGIRVGGPGKHSDHRDAQEHRPCVATFSQHNVIVAEAERERQALCYSGFFAPTTHMAKNCEPPPYACPRALPVFGSTW